MEKNYHTVWLLRDPSKQLDQENVFVIPPSPCIINLPDNTDAANIIGFPQNISSIQARNSTRGIVRLSFVSRLNHLRLHERFLIDTVKPGNLVLT